MAVFCQQARQNQDGTLTVEQVMDRMTVTQKAGPLPHVAGLVAVIALRCEAPWGAHELGLDVRAPDGAARRVAALQVDTSPETDAIARILRIDFEIEQFGIYWFGVLWNGRLVTRMKLEVRAAI
jgi:hypothetical protein